MKKIIACKGLSGSSKTTWAKALQDSKPFTYKRINKDDLRSMLDNSHWSKNFEKFIIKARDLLIKLALEEGYSVISDDTNLSSNHIERFKEIAKDYKNTIVEVNDSFLQVPLEECIKRDLKRLNSVGEAVIRKQYNDYFKKTKEVFKVPYDKNLPDCILVDIDGTLAHMKDRSPFDWKRVGEDSVDEAVKGIVTVYADRNLEYDEAEVILCSGRDSICRPETEAWLASNGIPYNKLLMRPQGDTRKDTIVKEELYKEHIEGKYNVLFVLDDRFSVVSKWRQLGLKCLQVQEGNF